MDLQFMMSTDATQLSTTTDDLTQLSIWIVLILLETCSSDLVHATRQMAVFALPSVTFSSRLPSWFSMNHLLPFCSSLGGFFAAAALATGAAFAACDTGTYTWTDG